MVTLGMLMSKLVHRRAQSTTPVGEVSLFHSYFFPTVLMPILFRTSVSSVYVVQVI